MPFSNVLLDAATKSLQQRIDPVDFGLELEAETYAAAGFLSLKVDTGTIVTGAPGARGLGPVTLDLSRFAQFAPADVPG